MYAIFRAQGKQFRAEPDAKLRIPSLDAEPGDRVTFDEVLLAEKDGDVRVGTPALAGAAVAAEIVGHGKDDKIVVYKMKRRKGYRRKQGHRQGFTEIRIVEISFPKGAKKAVAKAKPAAEAPKAEKPKAEVAPEPVVEETPAEVTEAAAEAPEAAAEAQEAGEYDITPAAAELAAEHGIDLSTIEGSGKDGRILKSDIDKAIKEKDA
jgi:large subunit ribosomal protein L21